MSSGGLILGMCGVCLSATSQYSIQERVMAACLKLDED